jgi:hypothetical protein
LIFDPLPTSVTTHIVPPARRRALLDADQSQPIRLSPC